MYHSYFGLDAGVFSLAPNPRYLYLSRRHREALAHLVYGVTSGGGFIELSGEVGAGKTTLCRCLLEQLPENVDLALILNPRLSALELVASICDALKVAYTPATTSLKVLVDALNAYLIEAHERGRRTVVLIDEAQNLSIDVLEQIRLLTNLETAREKLLQIILIGQPELRLLLERNELRQLAGRITARYFLGALQTDESAAYVRHRLMIAGCRTALFAPAALGMIHRVAGGIPRRINILCDRALLGAYAQDKRIVTARMVRRAAEEMLIKAQGSPSKPGTWGWMAGAGAMTLGTLLMVWWLLAGDEPPARQTASAVAAAPAAAIAASKPAVAVAVAPAAARPVPDTSAPLAQRLAQGIDTGLDEAARVLMSRLGVTDRGPSNQDLCVRARRSGIACLRQSGTWSKLRALGIPVAIKLVDPNGHSAYAVVQTVEQEQAVLHLAGADARYPLSTVDRYWFGDYTVLWQRPAPLRPLLKRGDSGRDVLWLSERLAHWLGLAGNARTVLFDSALEQRVRAFQRGRGLVEDGVVGDETLLYLAQPAPREHAGAAPGGA